MITAARGAAVFLSSLLGALLLIPTSAPSVAPVPQPRPSAVVVQADDVPSAAAAVEAAGGTVTRTLGAADGVAATIAADRLHGLVTAAAVRSVTPDARLQLLSTDEAESDAASNDITSLRQVAALVRADELWSDGFTGAGIDVALIDSGVAPVAGLDGTQKVVHGPDLSYEAPHENLLHLDTYGHGTHMAGIIAGRDAVSDVPDDAGFVGVAPDDAGFVGVAPDARLVSVKVADATGATDVSQVIAAIDWVITHRRSNGLDIRVLNLSFGTDGTQSPALDPLAYAVEQAWQAGIVVVAASGNTGSENAGLLNPARDPFIIAVGADDPNGTIATDDDEVPAWSSRGDGTRNPDLVAPALSIASLRVPGSFLDERFPTGRVDGAPRLFKGSGTSQATAITSGVVALLLQARPWLHPDRVKAALRDSARDVESAPATADGRGLVDARAAIDVKTHPHSWQGFEASTGAGSLDGARGSHRVRRDGEVLEGDETAFGTAWSPDALGSWSGGTWSGGTWSGGTWSGATWSGGTWSGGTWSGVTWSGGTWSGGTWSGGTWSGASWSGGTWSTDSW